jgi:hypothetical protein
MICNAMQSAPRSESAFDTPTMLAQIVDRTIPVGTSPTRQSGCLDIEVGKWAWW